MTNLQILEGSRVSDITCIDFSESLLATGSNDRTIRLWQQGSNGIFKEKVNSPLCGHTYGVNSLNFSPKGNYLASCSTDGTIILWSVQTGLPICTLRHPSGLALRVVIYSPSSTVLVSGGDDETLIVWDLLTNKKSRTLIGHEAMVTCAAFSPDSQLMVSGASSGELKLWDAMCGHENCLYTQSNAHDLGVMSCHFSSQINDWTFTLATCGNDDLVKIWSVCSGPQYSLSLLKILSGHTANVMSCRFNADGTLLVSGSGDKQVILWDVFKGEQISTLNKHSRYVTCCAFSVTDALIASGSNDKNIIIWKFSQEDVQQEAALEGARSWDCAAVEKWLEQLELESYKELFSSHHIDGHELLQLTDSVLQNDLHIESLGHRRRILKAIQTLKTPLLEELDMDDIKNFPEEFFCPITHDLMKDPVVASDGHSYERKAIVEWFKGGRTTSPLSNLQLVHTNLVPNLALRGLINKYCHL